MEKKRGGLNSKRSAFLFILVVGGITILYVISQRLSGNSKIDTVTNTVNPTVFPTSIPPTATRTQDKVYKTNNYQPTIFTGDIKQKVIDTKNFIFFSNNSVPLTFRYPSNWDSHVMKGNNFLPFNQDYGNVFQSNAKLAADTVCKDAIDCDYVGIQYWKGRDDDFINAYNNSLCLKFSLNNIKGCVYEFNSGGLISEYFDFVDKNNSGRFSINVSGGTNMPPELKDQILEMLSTINLK